MNKTTSFLRSFLKWVCILAAAGNLIFLFLFDYQLPGFLQRSAPASEETETFSSEANTAASIELEVPTQKLIYDGSETLDLMDDVSVIDHSGVARQDIDVFVSVKSGSSRKEKIIEYSATDEEGHRVTAERTLSIAGNYSGPLLEVLGDLPDIAEEELSSLAAVLIEDGIVKAEDGFGNDITSSVTASVKSEANGDGECIVTLSITNFLNDTSALDVAVSTQTSGPVLRLTTNKVTLSVGDSFSFYDYIASAQDEEGNSLFQQISMKGSVDTSTPGEYVLEFYCADYSGNVSPTKTLTVTVK